MIKGAWWGMVPITLERGMHEHGDYLLQLARLAISSQLTGKPLPTEDIPEKLKVPGACFVTLEIAGRLRGCIGSLQAHRPLAVDVIENARQAAFHDPRFPALTESEFAEVDLSLSLLRPPRALSFTSEQDMLDQVRAGHHGVIIADGGRRATFLPSVWEMLPDKEMFFSQLKCKAMLPADHWSNTMEVSVYEVLYFKEKGKG